MDTYEYKISREVVGVECGARWWYNRHIHVGAEFSFRQKEFNKLFCKSIVHVTYTFLIATFTAKVKAAAASVASAFRTPAFAPIAA
jgi:hypothetical protein